MKQRKEIPIGAGTLIIETGHWAKLANLFQGVREYGLLGFVWFNVPGVHDWRISGFAAAAALRTGAKTYGLAGP